MKPLLLLAAVAFTILGPCAELGHAQCIGPAGGVQVCNIQLGTGSIVGDESNFATLTATVHIPQGNAGGGTYLQFNGITVTLASCSAGIFQNTAYGLWCGSANDPGPTDLPLTIQFNGYNYGTSNNVGNVQVYLVCGGCSTTLPITVTPVGSPVEPPSSDPDGPCAGCGSGGPPINFLNGNAWIPQQDYFLPGLGGGITMTRTWNSLWPLMSPPEESGIFGDSWRTTSKSAFKL